jgi:hypothetical protein
MDLSRIVLRISESCQDPAPVQESADAILNLKLRFFEPSDQSTAGDITTNPYYRDANNGSFWELDLTPLGSGAAANGGCLNGGVICFAPATDYNGNPRTLNSNGHYPYGAYATTY